MKSIKKASPHGGKGGKMKKQDFLGLRISPEVKKSLTEMAEAEGRTLSNFVRRILEKEAKNKEAKKGM